VQECNEGGGFRMTAGEISLMTLFLILAPFVLVGLVWAMVLIAREMIVPAIKELMTTRVKEADHE